jgi:hypothetical protein
VEPADPSTQVSSSLFLSHNTDLGPPYRILVDTNFINFSIQNKIELVQGMMDCLMAKCECCGRAEEKGGVHPSP